MSHDYDTNTLSSRRRTLFMSEILFLNGLSKLLKLDDVNDGGSINSAYHEPTLSFPKSYQEHKKKNFVLLKA